jgi:hypothetical protein
MMQARVAERPAVLTSWKEIARYMGKGVRTVQRWEQEFGLPVRRPLGSDKKAVLARPSDLDSWVALRCGVSSRCARPGDPSTSALLLRSNVAAEMETSRRLRETCQHARGELRSALQILHERLSEICNKAA